MAIAFIHALPRILKHGLPLIIEDLPASGGLKIEDLSASGGLKIEDLSACDGQVFEYRYYRRLRITRVISQIEFQ
ncbi:MAG TPA: hypothetical protein PLD62_07155 [Candidatus Cloacimonadota bacterium]|nr:hypothetical protein [Candidatus Cloacimonadota bacterium]